MKKFIYILLISVTAFACKKNPLEDIDSGAWNKEKRLISISFENQVGPATISIDEDDLEKGTILTTIVNPDMTKPFVIKAMEVSYGSISSVKVGEGLSFDPITATASLSIKSHTGATRIYEIIMTPLVENITGEWQINRLDIFGGTGADYGGVDFVNLANDPKWWNSTTGLNAELDNTITFTFDGITEKGETYGTCVHDPGADGKYADFVWTGEVPEGQTVVDVNYNYRKVPIGSSTWKRSYSDQTLSFEQNEVLISKCSFIDSGNVSFWGKNLMIDNSAFKFSALQRVGGWGPIYSVYDKVIYMPWDYYVQISKR